MGSAATGAGRGEVATRSTGPLGEDVRMRFGNGPRRRRMIIGTIERIGGLAMRYGLASQLATLDCTSSRRSTVMCALLRAAAVTTVYQRASSSKRPSIVRRLRGPRTEPASEIPRGEHGIQGCAPCGRRLRRPWTPRSPRGRGSTYAGKLTLAGYRQATIERSGLDKGSFHISEALHARRSEAGPR